MHCVKNHWKIFLCLALAVFTVITAGCNKTDGIGESTDNPVDTTPVVSDLSIVESGSTQYTIITSENTSDKTSDAVRAMLDAFNTATGVKPKWTDDYLYPGDPVPVKEILVGITNREESKAVLREVRYGEYMIRTVGDKIVIAAWDEDSLVNACSAFISDIKQIGSNGTLAVPGDYARQDVGLSLLAQMPHYGAADEQVQFIDLADAVYMLLAKDTDLAEFEAYYGILEAAGYTCVSKHQMADNHYAVYTSEKKIIHAIYTAKDTAARIAIEDAYDMSLFTEQPYEKVCEPSVTMIGQENYNKDDEGFYYQKGMSLIFRLEDGRFIIVDGGGHNKTSLSSLYTTLQDLAPDKDHITVAAWFITHAHSDHVGTFLKFTEEGYHKSIRVENIIHHLVETDKDRTLQTREAFAAEYTNTNIIKAHTGQKIYAGGAEIEMLFTFADLMPAAVDDLNATSLMFRVTMGGKTVLILGDSTTYTSGQLVKTYGDYLKSDIVQIAHHGKTGGTVALYEKIHADVLLWPGGVANFKGEGTMDCLRARDYNAKALSLAKEAYIAGDKVFTLPMPYTPEDLETVHIIY